MKMQKWNDEEDAEFDCVVMKEKVDAKDLKEISKEKEEKKRKIRCSTI